MYGYDLPFLVQVVIIFFGGCSSVVLSWSLVMVMPGVIGFVALATEVDILGSWSSSVLMSSSSDRVNMSVSHSDPWLPFINAPTLTFGPRSLLCFFRGFCLCSCLCDVLLVRWDGWWFEVIVDQSWCWISCVCPHLSCGHAFLVDMKMDINNLILLIFFYRLQNCIVFQLPSDGFKTSQRLKITAWSHRSGCGPWLCKIQARATSRVKLCQWPGLAWKLPAWLGWLTAWSWAKHITTNTGHMILYGYFQVSHVIL